MNRFLAIFVMCALAAIPSFAQFDTAEVLGTVKDHSGAVVPKAALTLLHVDTGILAKTTADENGNYTFSNVKIGTYKVTA
ncbi:MAG TPA: carboxypeptidase-like regulatory domain-containing protein, partial [Bryobacteraceae bacterium]|nr:carboxypeptidase-like regulatory domain-containing protein [Bryobacteraceae bacterium]